jgi:hypothetical protein
MKKSLFLTVGTLLLIFACSKKNSNPDTNVNKKNNAVNLISQAQLGLDSPFIEIDSANKMITSYLNARSGENDLNALIIDAEALRYYLQNTDIKKIKLMFAHKLSYINNGGVNQYGGLNKNSLTLVIAAYDEDNDYVYSNYGKVMDFCEPCPSNCPQSGTAAQNTLPQ